MAIIIRLFAHNEHIDRNCFNANIFQYTPVSARYQQGATFALSVLDFNILYQ